MSCIVTGVKPLAVTQHGHTFVSSFGLAQLMTTVLDGLDRWLDDGNSGELAYGVELAHLCTSACLEMGCVELARPLELLILNSRNDARSWAQKELS